MMESEKKVRVLLVDDRIVLREGIHSVLEAEEDFEIVAEAVTVDEALSYQESLGADVVVTNKRMVPALQERLLETRVVTVENGDISPAELVAAVGGWSNDIQGMKEAMKTHLLSLIDQAYRSNGLAHIIEATRSHR